MPDLQKQYGPWVLITGASAGLGEEFAGQLAAQGFNLALVARRADRLEAVGQAMKEQHGVDYRAIACDLNREDFMPELAEQTADLEIGLLINNAGFTNSGNFLDNDLDKEIMLVNVNCRSATILAHHYGQLMRDRKRGGMVFSASIAGFAGIPFWATYSGSKSYDLLLAEALHGELKPHGIDVLAMCPGATRTEFATYEGFLANIMVMNAPDVVRGTLKRLGKRSVYVAGWINWINTVTTRFVPRWLASKLFGVVVRDIVKH